MDSRSPHRLEEAPTIEMVVGAMRRFAHGPQGKESLDIRALCEEIIAGVESGDYAGEVLAVYYWVCKHIRYSQDILGVEFVKTPTTVLKTKTGDCDDIACLLAAMLMSIGKRCRFVLAGFNRGAPPSHVFCAVALPDGTAIVLDPVANRVTSSMLARSSKARALTVVDVGVVDDADEDESFGYEDGSGGDPDAQRRTRRTFSVWDYIERRYDYYTAVAAPPPPTGGFRRPSTRGRPEGLAARLPSGAQKIGAGARAKGTIATVAPLGGFADYARLFNTRTIVGGAVGGLALWGAWRWATRKKRAR